MRTQGLTHIHLMVRDLERALTFYTRVFALKEQFREEPRWCSSTRRAATTWSR